MEERYRSLLQNGREVRENLARLRRAGGRVDYVACDVRDAGAFGARIDETYRRYGRIDGVVHGAGTIEDRLVRDKTLESFERVLETKVNGALVLAAKLRPESLRFLVFFGSIAGRFGNRGQGDYAAANEVLNKLAQDLDRRWPGRVVSINWGPWLQSGMVPPEVERQFAERGVVLIPPDVGCRMLVEELRLGRKGEAEILIGGARGPRALHAPAEPHLGSGRDKEMRKADPAPPLLLTAGVLSRGEGVVQVARPLSPDVDLYLRDHRLDGPPVLPFAMADGAHGGGRGRGLAGSWMWPSCGRSSSCAGVTVDGDAKEVRVVARPREGSEAADGSPAVPELDVSIADAGNPRLVPYRAVVELGRSGPASGRDGAPPGWPGNSGAHAGAGPMPMSVEETNREWLFHGPLFQGNASIEAIGPGGARAVLRPSSPRDCLRGGQPGEWLIDPVLVDSALQMQVIWARLHWDVTLLPRGVSEFAPVRAAPRRGRGSIRYELRVRPESQMPT